MVGNMTWSANRYWFSRLSTHGPYGTPIQRVVSRCDWLARRDQLKSSAQNSKSHPMDVLVEVSLEICQTPAAFVCGG